jgi:DNA-binding IscR family transcriptional regulator
VWRELQRRIDEMLSSVTLADLMRSEVEVETLVSA